MICENCGLRDAAVHLTRITDTSVSQVHLCEPCAISKGVDVTSSDPVEQFNNLVTYIPQIEAGYDPSARKELVRKLRELAAIIPPEAVSDEARAYLARLPEDSHTT